MDEEEISVMSLANEISKLDTKDPEFKNKLKKIYNKIYSEDVQDLKMMLDIYDFHYGKPNKK